MNERTDGQTDGRTDGHCLSHYSLLGGKNISCSRMRHRDRTNIAPFFQPNLVMVDLVSKMQSMKKDDFTAAGM